MPPVYMHRIDVRKRSGYDGGKGKFSPFSLFLNTGRWSLLVHKAWQRPAVVILIGNLGQISSNVSWEGHKRPTMQF